MELKQKSAIRKIEFVTKHLVDDILAGAYLSAFKGKGMEFNEVKEYQPGDDVRTIDWNVTARMGRPYVKNFHEERELTIFLVVDSSSSTRFGAGNPSKAYLIAEIGAAIAFSAMKNNDKVGLILFSEDVDVHLAPKNGLRHALRIIRELVSDPPLLKKTDLNKALSYLGSLQQRRAVCFVLSDFICDDFSKTLSILAKKHDMILISVTDPCENVFPNVNMATLADLETGATSIRDTGSANFKKNYQESFDSRIKELKILAGKVSAGFIDIRTNQSYLEALKRFFKSRSKKRYS